MSKFVVSFLVRPDCHLCTEAAPIVDRVVTAAGGEVNVIEIESSDELVAKYGLRIPVVIGPGGEVIGEGVVSERDLKKRLRKTL